MSKLLNFEHQILAELKELQLPQGTKLLLAVSGGADSIALLEVISRIHRILGFTVRVAYVHHGGKSTYRRQSLEFVKSESQKRGFDFLALGPAPRALSSEADMRMFRLKMLLGALGEDELVVFGHHKDDLLETRIIRLLRGVGQQGLVAMSARSGKKLRPMLKYSRRQILDYIEARHLDFVEDPSNSELRYLRNWLRNRWLPQLEKIRPGSLARLAESLENIASIREEWPPGLLLNNHTLDRPTWLGLTVDRQLSCLAQLLLSFGVRDFTKNQLKEILKHLDKSQNEHSFRVASCTWSVNAKHIIAVKG